MKISVVTWDASFRESFHTIDSFGKQNFDKFNYEFIWSEFYNNQNKILKSKIDLYSNFSFVNMNNSIDKKWHLGKTINHGIKHAKGDILIIPDGDIIVNDNFLNQIIEIFKNSCDDLVCYFRRYDEPKQAQSINSKNIDHLQKYSQLRNLYNYGGCLAIKYNTLKKFGFYEEHDVFSGPGANSLEQYKRFRNKGLKIMWSDIPIYHPFHDFTGTSDKISLKLKIASKWNKWINPYSGLEQSWILHMRDKNLDWKANDKSLDNHLINLKSTNFYLLPSPLQKIINKILI